MHNRAHARNSEENFFALLPFLQKAAEDALNDATASKGGSESSQKSESRQGEARTSGSSAPKPSAPKSSTANSTAPKPSAPASTGASDGSDYPGDYRDMINFEYSPPWMATLTRVNRVDVGSFRGGSLAG